MISLRAGRHSLTYEYNFLMSSVLSVLSFLYISGHYTEAYSEPCQTSKMECFAKIVNGFRIRSIADDSKSYEYASLTG